jgi:hypothetical protein
MAKITDKALAETIAALESELSATLAKAEPPAPESSDDSDSAPAEAPHEETPGEAPHEAPPESPPQASPEASAPDAAQDPAQEDGPVDPAALQAEYAQLSPEELDMHLQAAMAAKEALMGAAGAGAGSPPPPAAPPVAPPMAPPAGSPPPMMGKSEVTDLKAQVEKLSKALDEKSGDIDLLVKFVTAPKRKAITEISQVKYLGKSEDTSSNEPRNWTAAEAKQALHNALPSLSKAERDLVVKYNVHQVGIEALAPILEKVMKK